MRDIRFRAFHTRDDGKRTWIYGWYAKKDDTRYCREEDYANNPVKTRHYIISERFPDWGLPTQFKAYEIDPETVGEFTGVFDRNGSYIYEGDILQIGDDPTDRFQVVFDGGVVWADYIAEDEKGTCGIPLFEYDESDLLIVGNIYKGVDNDSN